MRVQKEIVVVAVLSIVGIAYLYPQWVQQRIHIFIYRMSVAFSPLEPLLQLAIVVGVLWIIIQWIKKSQNNIFTPVAACRDGDFFLFL